MEVVTALLNGGAFGVVAAVMLYLYIGEKTAHKDTQVRLEQALKDRIDDQKENMKNVVEPLRYVGSGLQGVNNKIEIAKRQ